MCVVTTWLSCAVTATGADADGAGRKARAVTIYLTTLCLRPHQLRVRDPVRLVAYGMGRRAWRVLRVYDR